ncbi:AAA family ATPase [Paenibacillus hamazuiensis]|uniref:AAA family ATPase n=1 Tax=Paenibacillus hamazuiensis TaxID=2936508 RepID=UPI00200CD63E|nr:AAA family ATPase [Paenibacillus hamazuiensis]
MAVLNERYSRFFGLEEPEVEQLLEYYVIGTEMAEVKKWYNGYIFGETVIYNPWSS